MMNMFARTIDRRISPQWISGTLLMVIGLAGNLAWAAQNGLEAVSVAKGKNDSQVVKIQFKQDVNVEPVTFVTSNPNRLVLDFADTASALGRGQEELNSGAIKSYQVVQSGGRTRLVINLTGPANYEVRKDKNVVYAVLQGGATSSVAHAPTLLNKAVAVTSNQNVRDVEFQRGKNGESKITVTLSNAGVAADIQQKGKTIQVDFLGTALPASLQKRLDVSDFATPAQLVETFAQENNTRMVITPKGKWDYYSYQVGDQFVLEVRPLDEQQASKIDKPTYSGEKLTLNFQNVDVRAVLQVIADFTGLNIVASDTVNGNITLRLKDVPWDQALDIIMRSRGLDKRVSGNVIWIAPRDEMASKEKAELEAKQQIAQLEELQTEMIRLNYLRADEAQKIILGLSLSGTPAGAQMSCSTDVGELKIDSSKNNSPANAVTASGSNSIAKNANSLISSRGSVTYDLKTNAIFLKETPSQIEKIKALLAHVDVPARQIMIEARVVLAGDSFGRTLGARLGFSAFRSKLAIGNTLDSTSSSLLAGGGLPVNPQVNLDAPSVLNSTTTAPSIGISVLNAAANTMLSLELQALEADKRGKVVSSPRVITQNQQPAVIMQGTQIPNIKPATGDTPPTIEYKDALLCLLVDPQVLNNDEIILNVSVNKDVPGNLITLPGGGSATSIDTKRVRTAVRVKNGETAVLGGVYEQELIDNTEKVPFLGDLPFLGFLFKSHVKEDKKAELLIFLTPRLLDDAHVAR